MNYSKKFIAGFCVLISSVFQFGCGGEGGTNAPVTKLTASTIASDIDTTAHVHEVTIPFTDVSAAPASDVYQFRSGVSNGHSHVIAISKQQMIDLNNGMRLAITSSTPNSGTSHTHTWSIQGGSLLYEKNCYNCHTNDKRYHSPMNVSFNSSQTSAVINPGSAPLSTSATATPDPIFLTSAMVSLDGASLYAANCSTCHGSLASSSKQNKTFDQIKAAITSNMGGMASLGSLSAAQLQAIATALIK